ncbi:MAG: glycine betaine ABC transporter substrate-binding protein, partial [Pirellulales bacterium]
MSANRRFSTQPPHPPARPVTPFALAAVTVACCMTAGCSSATTAAKERSPLVRVGSKPFTESRVLSEIVAQLARSAGARTEKHRLGGTQLLFKALQAGEIDVYPEYTGTIAEEILAGQGLRTRDEIRAALAERSIQMSRPLGFDNTYVLGMKEERAARLGIRTISDLRQHPDVPFGFSTEFLDREDGWKSLRRRYQLPQTNVRGMQHDLAYRAIDSGSIDVTDLYSTDAEIQYYGLRPLEDDLGHFPEYEAVLLYSDELFERAPAVVAALRRLEGRIDEAAMIRMNARAKIEKVPAGRVAAAFLAEELSVQTEVFARSFLDRLLVHTWQHLYLVAVSLAGAIAISLPLGVAAAQRPRFGQVILGGVGVLQTVPSLALLVFMIPLLGIGAKPAIAGLLLYSLLPIVRNTHAGLHDIPLEIRESAAALGLPRAARLWKIELPIASRSILAGIKTSAVINVGTATLGGFIGAGGYG